ncbi:MAG: O-antigen ligase family protein [Dermatophilaceae bacterium]
MCPATTDTSRRASDASAPDAKAPDAAGRCAPAPGLASGRSLVGHGVAAATVGFGLYLTWHVVLVQVLPPRTDHVVVGGAVLLGGVAALAARARGGLVVVGLVCFWAVIGVLLARWVAGGHADEVLLTEARSMAAFAACSVALVLLSRGHRSGVAALRWMWLLVVVTNLPVGAWEALTRQRLVPDPIFGPVGDPSAVFHNPNNFAAVLLLGIGLCLLWLAERPPAAMAVLLIAVAAVSAWLLTLTHSRMALAFCFPLAVLVAVGAAHRWAWHRRLITWAGQHPATARLSVAAAVMVTMAVFTVPRLFGLNLLYRVLFPDDAAISASDRYRLDLLRIGGQLWASRPWTGVGGGRFETLLTEARPDIVPVLPVHNVVVEVLCEYGLVALVPLLALFVVLSARAVPRPHDERRGAGAQDQVNQAGATAWWSLDELGGRYLLAVVLLALVYGGGIIDSALGWMPWWMMLATAVSLAWWLGPRGARALAAGGQD